jgi:hypothetical protein
MIRIAITPAAYAAIAATLPGSVGVEPGRAPNGDFLIRFDPAVVNRLAAKRDPGETAATRPQSLRNGGCGCRGRSYS